MTPLDDNDVKLIQDMMSRYVNERLRGARHEASDHLDKALLPQKIKPSRRDGDILTSTDTDTVFQSAAELGVATESMVEAELGEKADRLHNHTAGEIPVDHPTGDLLSGNVESALVEVERGLQMELSEKADRLHGHPEYDKPMCVIYQSTTQSFATGTSTTVQFDSVFFDELGWAETASYGIRVPIACRIAVTAGVAWSSGNGRQYAVFRDDGVFVATIFDDANPGSGYNYSPGRDFFHECAANSLLTVTAAQYHGSNRSSLASPELTYLGIRLLQRL